ncbi:MAG: ribonuclease [Pseudomonadota bacterium]|jgi:ribonuclease D
MPLITNTAALDAACQRLGSHDFVTIDTEFMRESTFFPKLCLIQLASEDEDVLIDPLAPDIDLAPFFALMRKESVVKVFHSGRQDIEILWILDRCIPSPCFDTQVAAMVAGYGDSVGYEQLAHDLAKARIDKSSRYTDWSQRPLSDAQLNYARADVTHLRVIYKALLDKLSASGREPWLADEMRVLTSPETYDLKPEDSWRRLSGRIRKPRDLAVLMEIAAWRETEARSRNVPRSRVLKDDAIIDIATSAPRSVESLGKLRSVPNGFERSRVGTEILALVEKGLARDPSTIPVIERIERKAYNPAAVELLKVLLRMTCDKEGVAAKLIATVDDLESIAADDNADVQALKGWRYKIFGQHALELKNGNLALAFSKGRVVALPRNEA